MKKCIYCEIPNPDGWFYCKICGNRAFESKFTTNLYMRSPIGKRTDIEFSTTTMDEVIEKDKKELAMKNSVLMNKKLKQYKRRGYA